MRTTIDEFKLAAIRLSKAIQSSRCLPPENNHELLSRLRKIGAFQQTSLEELEKKLCKMTLADCQQIIALEAGEKDWENLLKTHTDIEQLLTSDEYLLYDKSNNAGDLNIWFPNYIEAKTYLDNHKGFYLLPYKNTFFLCRTPYIEGLGIKANDPDWTKIGYNWVQPLDPTAKNRLREKLVEAKKRQWAGKTASRSEDGLVTKHLSSIDNSQKLGHL